MPRQPTKKKSKAKVDIDVAKHVLVPKHSKLTEKERKELFSKYQLDFKQLPKIFIHDAAIKDLGVEHGDIVKIERKSATAGHATFYRVVYDERKEL